jgi:hypothetical protein
VCRSKHVEPLKNFGIINSITKLHFAGISTESVTVISYIFWFVNIVIKVVYHGSFCLYCGGEINVEYFYTDMIGLFIS